MLTASNLYLDGTTSPVPSYTTPIPKYPSICERKHKRESCTALISTIYIFLVAFLLQLHTYMSPTITAIHSFDCSECHLMTFQAFSSTSSSLLPTYIYGAVVDSSGKAVTTTSWHYHADSCRPLSALFIITGMRRTTIPSKVIAKLEN